MPRLQTVCCLALVSASACLRLPAGLVSRPVLRVSAQAIRLQEFEDDEFVDEFGNVRAVEEATPKQELSEEAQRVYQKMRNKEGVELTPWMKIDPEAVAQAEKMRAARKARKEREAKSLDGVEIDPQAAELGGGGLKSKVISEEEVRVPPPPARCELITSRRPHHLLPQIELSWATDNEADNKGYIVQRRPGGARGPPCSAASRVGTAS